MLYITSQVKVMLKLRGIINLKKTNNILDFNWCCYDLLEFFTQNSFLTCEGDRMIQRAFELIK